MLQYNIIWNVYSWGHIYIAVNIYMGSTIAVFALHTACSQPTLALHTNAALLHIHI